MARLSQKLFEDLLRGATAPTDITLRVTLWNGAWVGFEKATGLLNHTGSKLIADPLVRGTFEQCLAVDVESLQ